MPVIMHEIVYERPSAIAGPSGVKSINPANLHYEARLTDAEAKTGLTYLSEMYKAGIKPGTPISRQTCAAMMGVPYVEPDWIKKESNK